MTEQTGKEGLFIKMATAIRANGKMTMLMAEELMSTRIVPNMLGTGKKTSNMATVLKLGLI